MQSCLSMEGLLAIPMNVWCQHFQSLGESRAGELAELRKLTDKIDSLAVKSFENEEFILDVPFTEDEVSYAVKRLKGRKAAGLDGVVAEHLKEGGHMVIRWLTRIFKAIVDLEAIPASLKTGLVVPIYKRGGRNPALTDSYRGITLTSVVSKVLESLVLERMMPVLKEAGCPHINQTAYRKESSCADALFATQETIVRYIRGGKQVYMCLYDLAKAYDSVEYSILLKRLFEVGVNGKVWRLVRDWYQGM